MSVVLAYVWNISHPILTIGGVVLIHQESFSFSKRQYLPQSVSFTSGLLSFRADFKTVSFVYFRIGFGEPSAVFSADV